jgi:hypothetical protein
MKLSRSKSAVHREETTVKRVLLVLSAAVVFLTTLVVPTTVKADGTPTGTNCGNTMCKP